MAGLLCIFSQSERHHPGPIIFISFSRNLFLSVVSMGKPVLMDFFADWCGPCRQQGPIIDELKAKMGDRVEIKKVDVDHNMDLATRYAIRVVPTIVIEQDGKVLRTFEGVQTLDSLEKFLLPLVK